jgi:hypothetical protein
MAISRSAVKLGEPDYFEAMQAVRDRVARDLFVRMMTDPDASEPEIVAEMALHWADVFVGKQISMHAHDAQVREKADPLAGVRPQR